MEFLDALADRTRLSEAMTCEIEDDGKTVTLHMLRPKKEEATYLAPILKSSLEKLAEMLQNNPRFKNIERVVGFSWIITEHPKLLERAGFHMMDFTKEIPPPSISLIKEKYEMKVKNLDAGKRNIPPHAASISKEDLIRIYGKKNAVA